MVAAAIAAKTSNPGWCDWARIGGRGECYSIRGNDSEISSGVKQTYGSVGPLGSDVLTL